MRQRTIRILSIKLLRSPNSNSDNARTSRLSFDIFYFATGDTQKDSDLETEFTQDTEASCSIFNYRTFWEISHLQHPITTQKNTKLNKTYSRQTGPMVGYATLNLCYDLDVQFVFPLTVLITEMKTQYLLGTDFCQKQVSGIHFDLPGIELKSFPTHFVEVSSIKTTSILIYLRY